MSRSPASFKLVPYPVWVFDIDDYGYCWGNHSALEYWDVESVDEFVARDMSENDNGAVGRMMQSFERAASLGFSKDP